MRAFLAFLEARGAGEVLARELAEAIDADGPDVRDALVAAGIVRAAPRAATVPCDGIDCAREVRERRRATPAGPALFAVCTRSPRECETVSVDEADLAQESVDLGSLLDVVRKALRIEAPIDRARRAEAHSAETPLLLGEQVRASAARDVFFARRPAAPAFRALLAERRTHPRGALVLVPTARGLDPTELASAKGAHVEVAALSDRLVVRDGRIVLATGLRVVPDAGARLSDGGPSVGRARLPRAERWNEVTFFNVDDTRAVGVAIGRHYAKVTAIDLGLADARTREPVRAFDLLRRICDGNGAFNTKPWGGQQNGRKIVSELRLALTRAFGIEDAPIGRYSKGAKSWKAKFRALAAAPGQVSAVERAIRAARREE